MGRAQSVCEASFRLNLFEGFLFQSETISDETPTIADAVTIYRVLLPAVLLFFFLFFPAVCNLVVKLRNKTTSRKRPLLETKTPTAPVEGTHGGKESFYLNMDAFHFFLFGFYFLSWETGRAETHLTHAESERACLLLYIIHLYTSVCNCNMKGFYFLYGVSVGSCLFHERTTGPPLIFKPPPPPTNEIFLLYPSIRSVCLSIRPPDRLS